MYILSLPPRYHLICSRDRSVVEEIPWLALPGFNALGIRLVNGIDETSEYSY